MHVLIVNFKLDGVDEGQYRALCDELAPAFADVPGLESKVWLADPGSGTYGGVYLFRDEDAFAAFASSELAAGVADHPNLADVTMRDFGVIDAPTEVTRGALAAFA
jgi:hypothetical protein